jgi:hypothetical protein
VRHLAGARSFVVALTMAGLLGAGLLGAGAALAAPAAPAAAARPAAGAVVNMVLVNQPVARVCVGAAIRVGVWFQRFSGGSRAYRVAVFSPHGRLVFYRHGRASAAHWRFWKVTARLAGRYRTVYHGHWRHPRVWSKYRVITRARHCG